MVRLVPIAEVIYNGQVITISASNMQQTLDQLGKGKASTLKIGDFLEKIKTQQINWNLTFVIHRRPKSIVSAWLRKVCWHALSVFSY